MDTREIFNRRARHDYEVLDTLETGIVLKGSEVKSLRQGKASLLGSFAKVDRGEVWLMGAHIDEYLQGNRFNHDPKRFRKLLLKKAEIRDLTQKSNVKGFSLIPLKIYFNERGIAKVQLGICRGKSGVDRRQDLKKKEDERQIRAAMKHRSRFPSQKSR